METGGDSDRALPEAEEKGFHMTGEVKKNVLERAHWVWKLGGHF